MGKELKIGVDLDGIVFDFLTPYIEFVNKKRGLGINDPALTRSQVNSWNWLVDQGYCTYEEEKELFKEFIYTGGFLNLPIIEGARHNLYKLVYDLGCDVNYITSRHESSLYDTFEAIERAGLGFGGVHFSSKDNPKWELCKALDIDVLIDDHIVYLNEANENYPEMITILGNLDNLKYIHELEKSDSIIYVTSWDEIYNTIEVL